MEEILLVVVLGLGAACWWLWGEWTKCLREVERLKAAFTNLQMEFREKDSTLTTMAGDYRQHRETTSKTLSIVSSELNRVADMFLPPIENVREILVRMSADDIAKSDVPFSYEFQHTLTQLAAQKGESIACLNEAGLRLSLGVKYLMIVGALNPHSVEYVGEHLQDMQRVMQAQAPLVNMSGFKEWSVMNFAVSMNRLKKAFLNGDEPPSAEDIKLWMRAFDVVLASTAEGKSSQDDVEQEKTETPHP